MKAFHYKLGHVAGETMTVAELRAKLSEYPDDMPVFAEWEGCWGYVKTFRVEVAPGHNEADRVPCLIANVEDYY